MEQESASFAFRKLREFTYLTLDVLKYVYYEDAYTFMFGLDRGSRSFIQKNFITARNEFYNEGLIDYEFDLGYFQ